MTAAAQPAPDDDPTADTGPTPTRPTRTPTRTPAPPDIDPDDGPGPVLGRTGWTTSHTTGCWRYHPTCALIAARDLHLMRRDHSAAVARRFGDLAARGRHVPPAERRLLFGADLASARATLQARERGTFGGDRR